MSNSGEAPPHQQHQVTTLSTLQFHPSETANHSLLHFHQQILLVKEGNNPTLVYTRSCWPATTQDSATFIFSTMYSFISLQGLYKTLVCKLMGESRVCRWVSGEMSWIIQMSHGFTCIWEPYSLFHCNLLSGGAEVSTWKHTCCNLPDCGHGYHIVRRGRIVSSSLSKLQECSYEDRSISMHAQGIQRSPVLETSTRFIRTQYHVRIRKPRATMEWDINVSTCNQQKIRNSEFHIKNPFKF